MAEKYPHDALVRAWLDGKTIQYLEYIEGRNVWLDIDGPGVATKMPHFYSDFEHYRIKPVVVRYRVALLRRDDGGCFTESVSSPEGERTMSSDSLFVRWITDWTEVVV